MDVTTTRSFTSGQPTCTGNLTSRRRNQKHVHDVGGEWDDDEKLKGRKKTCHDDSLVNVEETDVCPRLVGHTIGSHDKRVAEAEYEGQQDNEEDERRRRVRWYCRDFRRVTEMVTRTLLLGIVLLVTPGKSSYYLSTQRNCSLS